MTAITLTLPYPISANRYWRQVIVKGHAISVPTKEAKAYIEEVGWMCKQAGIRQPFPGRVAVHIALYPQRPQDWLKRMQKLGAEWDNDVRCMDLDNARKVLYDALKGIAFTDDDRVFEDSGKRMEPDANGARVVVTITPLQVAQPQVALDLKQPANVAAF